MKVCVVGGGPAGMMLGYLLARAGVEVTVLEKHNDFFRDFRGDTIHPATTEVMAQLGLLTEFLTLPHSEVAELAIGVEGTTYGLVDFTRLRTACRFMAFMPQWDFLNFMAEKARAHPSFHLRMGAEATDLVIESQRVTGVRIGDEIVAADLTVACDGRFSVLREKSGLPVLDFPMPIDALWFRVPREESAAPTLGYVGAGQVVLTIDRGDYWQCGTIIGKGSMDRLVAAGLDAFRQNIAAAAPFLAGPLESLTDWDQVRLLSVLTNRLERWHRPGLLFIGDAAHAMAPVGAAGVNYAIADAVATANILVPPLRAGTLSDADLHRVQRRRAPAIRMVQAAQRQQTANLVRLAGPHPPLGLIRTVARLGFVRHLLGRIIGLGFRPEHLTLDSSAPINTPA